MRRGYKLDIMKNTIIALLLIGFTASCGRVESNYSLLPKGLDASGYMSSETEEEYKRADNRKSVDYEGTSAEGKLADQKIVKEGRLTFQTNDLIQTNTRIDSLVRSLDGFCTSETEVHYTYQDQLNLTIRIPVANFEKLINSISVGVDHFDNKEISAEDVTEEFIDLEARTKTKKETEQRYREILKEANTVAEILEIEAQISNLRSDIESLEGRLKYLIHSVDYSTVHVNVYKEIKGGPKQQYSNQFVMGFKKGWDGFVLFFIALTYTWPFLIIGVIVSWVIRRKIRSNRAKKSVVAK